MSKPIKFSRFSDNSILITFSDGINAETRNDIYRFNHAIKQFLPDKTIETVPCYTSLTVFHHAEITQKQLIKDLQQIYANLAEIILPKSKTWHIPVCYHENYAPDLAALAQSKGLSQQEFIKLHSQNLYTIDFIGFLPGFPYLSGLDKRLHMPRLQKPRAKIAQGSVGIGGAQTGVYPQASPAGWHIIGRTKFNFFDAQNIPPCPLRPLDKIQFVPISLAEFKAL